MDIDKIISEIWMQCYFSKRFVRLKGFPKWRVQQTAHETKMFFYSRRAILGGL